MIGQSAPTNGVDAFTLDISATKARVAELERVAGRPPTYSGVWNVKWFGARGDGVHDDTTAIAAAISAAQPGETVTFPAGAYLTDPQTVPKMLRFQGAGRWASRLVANGTGPILFFDLPATSPTIWGYYGAEVTGLGIDMSGFPGATGIMIGYHAGWPRIHDVVISEGAVSLDIRSPNGWVQDAILLDAGKFISIDELGLELVLRDVNMSRNIAGTTTVGIECICTTTGIKGALYVENVRLSCNSAVGSTLTGMHVEAPSTLSVPVFASNLIIDNTIGGGPGLNLVNVMDVSLVNSWINTGAASGGPAVRISGGANLKFQNNSYYGGGSPAKTYDFVGGSTAGFVSTGNYCPTGPVYYLPASGGPTDMQLDDIVPGATVPAQVTNDVPQLNAARALAWGAKHFMSPTILVQNPITAITAIGFANSWADTPSVISYFWKDSFSKVHVSGLVTSGTASGFTTLPTGFRPIQTQRFAGLLDDGTTCQVQILTTGQIDIFAPVFPVLVNISLEFSFLWGGG